MPHRARVRTNTNLAVTIFVLHVVLSAICLLKAPMGERFIWAAVFSLVASIPYINAIKKKNFIPYEAIFVFMGAFGFSYIFPLFLSVGKVYNLEILRFVIKMAVLSIICVSIGYRIKIGDMIANRLPLKNFIISDKKVLGLPMKFYLLWIALDIYALINPNIKPNIRAAWYSMIRLSIYVGIITDAYIYLSQRVTVKNKGPFLIRLIFFYLLWCISCFLEGFSGKMLEPLILIFLIYVKEKKKIPVVFIISLFIFGNIMLRYITPFTKAFRSQRWYGTSIEESVKYAQINFKEQDKVVRVATSESRASNVLEITLVCVQARHEGTKARVYNDFMSYISRFVPRFMWRNKPEFDYSKAARQLRILHSRDYATAVSIPMLGSFVLDGGVTGVIVGMLLVGVALRILWSWLVIRSGENFLTFIIYLIVIPTWTFGGEDLGTVLVCTVTFVGYAYLLLGIINKK